MTNSELLIERQRAAVAWLIANNRGLDRISAAQAKLDALLAYQPRSIKRRKHISLAETPGLMAGPCRDLPKSGRGSNQVHDPEWLCTSSIREPHVVYATGSVPPPTPRYRPGPSTMGPDSPTPRSRKLRLPAKQHKGEWQIEYLRICVNIRLLSEQTDNARLIVLARKAERES